ncbi:MAG TPA: hypothetical protein VGG25_31290 [Streptosporangiaceae bacterium]|jgi:hypothetical protein
MTEHTAGSSADQPVYFKWVRDDDGELQWGKILLRLGVTIAIAYLSVQAQRTASSPDLNRTLAMNLARRRITLGVKVQRAGQAIEDAGWTAYHNART